MEPVTPLADLYISRARQIKLKYDYVVIFYSGGADSSDAALARAKLS
jgi:PP-loop superfamily ATP-utilizing enzyme